MSSLPAEALARRCLHHTLSGLTAWCSVPRKQAGRIPALQLAACSAWSDVAQDLLIDAAPSCPARTAPKPARQQTPRCSTPLKPGRLRDVSPAGAPVPHQLPSLAHVTPSRHSLAHSLTHSLARSLNARCSCEAEQAEASGDQAERQRQVAAA